MNIGVIGVGKLGEFHTKLLTEIARDRADIRCAGIYDQDSKRVEEISAKYGVSSFSSLELLADFLQAFLELLLKFV